MLIRTIFLLFIALDLFSLTLNSIYYVNSKNIKLQDIVPDADYDVTLYQIELNRYTKKIKSKELIKTLSKHGFKSVESSSRYVKFIKKSPIDLSKIQSKVTNIYKEKYPDISIDSVIIMPRGYIKSLPPKYEVVMKGKSHLSNNGTLSIKTLDNKKMFFDYLVDADITVYVTKVSLRRGDRVSSLNTSKKKVNFDKFRSLPINVKQLNISQLKRHLKSQSIITARDIETLNLVKKGSIVNVNLNNNNINISFSAKALQNGKLRDIITVQKRNKERLRVKVVGKNMVEIKE